MPMIWREPIDDANDFYFCMLPPIAKRLSKKKKYPNIPSTLRPLFYNEDTPVPEASGLYETESDELEENETSEPEPSTSYEQDYCPTCVYEPYRQT